MWFNVNISLLYQVFVVDFNKYLVKKLFLCLTFISPLIIPGVCGKPVWCSFLLSPSKYLDSVAAKHLPCHMLVHTYSNIKHQNTGSIQVK